MTAVLIFAAIAGLFGWLAARVPRQVTPTFEEMDEALLDELRAAGVPEDLVQQIKSYL